MACFLGIDTSNYTTSAAVFDSVTNTVTQLKKLLPVKNGTLGLKQGDAVFSHVRQLGPILNELLFPLTQPLMAIGVSIRPRSVEGSYMPCFLTGHLAAQAVSAALQKPLHTFSHQQGHLAAAVYSAGRMDLFHKPFIAFHISGGTTECLLVTPNQEHIFDVSILSTTLDLNMGQAIDRVGVMLGMQFPCGPALETLAATSNRTYHPKPTFKGDDVCVSGLENQCKQMLNEGEAPEDIANYCLSYVLAVLERMTKRAKELYPDYPLLYAGGVMSNAMINRRMSECYNGLFAAPQFSSDNAAGIALLTAMKENCYD